MAMSQPPLISPTTFARGTRTSSKNTSLKSSSPVICVSGRTVTPGLCMSTSRNVMPLCLGASRIGAHQQHAPVGVAREARPDLLAGDDEVVAVEVGAGLAARPDRSRRWARRSPGTRSRRRRGSLCRWRPLLRLGAVRDQHRAAHGEAGEVDQQRRLGARHLLLEDDLLDQRRAAPAVGARPGTPHQPAS